jgi:preprotein translocase subunit SecE
VPDKNMKTILKLPNTIIKFLRATLVELRQVEWLSRKETIRLTTIVLVVTSIFGVTLALLDKVLTLLITNFLQLSS